jgi:hypothetical protein
MRRFSNRLSDHRVSPDIEFMPETFTPSQMGGYNPSIPNSGPMLWGSVQPEYSQRTGTDGLIFSITLYHVFLFDDPSSLNGGHGVRTDDCFRWQGLILKAEGPHFNVGGISDLWEVDCVEKR